MSTSKPESVSGNQATSRELIDQAFDQYYGDIFRYVNFRINNEDIAEEIASEVFIRLVETVGKNKYPGENIKGWLFVTASHIVVDHYRQGYKKPEIELNDEIMDSNYEVSQEFELNEKRNKLAESLGSLTQEQQDVINYRFNLEYSIEDTAKLMKKNINAVKQLQFRAITTLKKYMSEQ